MCDYILTSKAIMLVRERDKCGQMIFLVFNERNFD